MKAAALLYNVGLAHGNVDNTVPGVNHPTTFNPDGNGAVDITTNDGLRDFVRRTSEVRDPLSANAAAN